MKNFPAFSWHGCSSSVVFLSPYSVDLRFWRADFIFPDSFANSPSSLFDILCGLPLRLSWHVDSPSLCDPASSPRLAYFLVKRWNARRFFTKVEPLITATPVLFDKLWRRLGSVPRKTYRAAAERPSWPIQSPDKWPKSKVMRTGTNVPSFVSPSIMREEEKTQSAPSFRTKRKHCWQS